MDTYRRKANRTMTIEALNGDKTTIVEDKEYLTSAPHDDDSVTVFSSFWERFPVDAFYEDSVQVFTKEEKTENEKLKDRITHLEQIVDSSRNISSWRAQEIMNLKETIGPLTEDIVKLTKDKQQLEEEIVKLNSYRMIIRSAIHMYDGGSFSGENMDRWFNWIITTFDASKEWATMNDIESSYEYLSSGRKEMLSALAAIEHYSGAHEVIKASSAVADIKADIGEMDRALRVLRSFLPPVRPAGSSLDPKVGIGSPTKPN